MASIIPKKLPFLKQLICFVHNKKRLLIARCYFRLMENMQSATVEVPGQSQFHVQLTAFTSVG